MSANVIDSHLANIINNDITKNVFSEKAKVASVRPIFKKNEREKIENYRSVSILNCFSKVYKKFLLDIPTATTEEINKIIKELDPKKATGLDKIPPKIVKMSANVIDSHLANIINNDITKNVFSEKAKVASVRPIFKKNEREKIENYRSVSILNCFSKVYEKFLLEKFKPFINSFLSEYMAA